MQHIENNILLYGSISDAMNMMRDTHPGDMARFLLLALQRGDRKLFDFVNRHASIDARLQVIRRLTEVDMAKDEIFQAIDRIALPGAKYAHFFT